MAKTWNPTEPYQLMIQAGLTPNQAMGALASMAQESGFNPGADNTREQAYGYFQFRHPDRRAPFVQAVPDWKTNPQGQIQYMFNQDPYGVAYRRQNFETPEAATEWFSRKVERPGDTEREVQKRLGHMRGLRNVVWPGGAPQAPAAATGAATAAAPARGGFFETVINSVFPTAAAATLPQPPATGAAPAAPTRPVSLPQATPSLQGPPNPSAAAQPGGGPDYLQQVQDMIQQATAAPQQAKPREGFLGGLADAVEAGLQNPLTQLGGHLLGTSRAQGGIGTAVIGAGRDILKRQETRQELETNKRNSLGQIIAQTLSARQAAGREAAAQELLARGDRLGASMMLAGQSLPTPQRPEYVARRDTQGNITGWEAWTPQPGGGPPARVPVPGVPETVRMETPEGRAERREADELAKKAAAREAGRDNARMETDSMIGLVESMVRHPGMPSAFGLAGMWPIPMTEESQDFAKLQKQFDAKAMLANIQKMVGMGHLSDAEGRILARAMSAFGTPGGSEEGYKLEGAIIRANLERMRKRDGKPLSDEERRNGTEATQQEIAEWYRQLYNQAPPMDRIPNVASNREGFNERMSGGGPVPTSTVTVRGPAPAAPRYEEPRL